MSTHFPDLEAFYAAEPARRHATEVDIGLAWREEPDGQDHRVSWIAGTGELIAVALASSGGGGGEEEPQEAVELVGAVPPSTDSGVPEQGDADALAAQCAFPGTPEVRSLPALRELLKG